MTETTTPAGDLLALTADIITAHAAHNRVSIAELPALIKAVHQSLANLGAPLAPVVEDLTPAVPIRSSVKADHIVCLEDGKKLKMLKRHLMTSYQMTPDQYRARWKLPADYPMVAPNYAEQRRSLALKIGLGRKAAVPAPQPAPKIKAASPAPTPAPKNKAPAPKSKVASPAPAPTPAPKKARGPAKKLSIATKG
jgi:predicted transcriptional regulator